MKTNSKEVRNAIKNHILECVYNYSENTFPTLKEACNHLYNEFNRVANHAYNQKRIPNEQKRFEDYLQGVPFHFYYTNEDIETFLNSLGINKEGKKYEPSKMWNLYAYLIYSETLKNKQLKPKALAKEMTSERYRQWLKLTLKNNENENNKI